MVFLRVLVGGRNAGRQSAPHMAQVDARTDGLLHAILLAFVFILVFQFLFRRKHLCQVAPVRESIHDVPFHIRLLHIAHRVPLQVVFLVPEHTLLEIGEGLVGFGILVPHHGAIAIVVLRTFPHPEAFGQGKHARVEIVFEQHVRFLGEQAVMPQGDDGAHHIGILLRTVVHTAIIQGHHIGESIEMVGIMETAVYVRNARSDLSVEAPHLHEVYFARLVFPSRVP